MTRVLIVRASPDYLEGEVNDAIKAAEKEGWDVETTYPIQFHTERYGVAVYTTAIGIQLGKAECDADV